MLRNILQRQSHGDVPRAMRYASPQVTSLRPRGICRDHLPRESLPKRGFPGMHYLLVPGHSRGTSSFPLPFLSPCSAQARRAAPPQQNSPSLCGRPRAHRKACHRCETVSVHTDGGKEDWGTMCGNGERRVRSRGLPRNLREIGRSARTHPTQQEEEDCTSCQPSLRRSHGATRVWRSERGLLQPGNSIMLVDAMKTVLCGSGGWRGEP
jgi:hypothetical protein